MTTIAWRFPYMASDGRVTVGTRIYTDRSEKIEVLPNGALLGIAGAFDARPIVEMFSKCRSPATFPGPKEIADQHIDFRAILAWPDGSTWCVECGPDYKNSENDDVKEWYAMVYRVHDPYFAIGSGGPYAKAAMDMGASAERAVRTALKSDSASGGKLQVHELHLKRGRRG